jgi:hypothetical protein
MMGLLVILDCAQREMIQYPLPQVGGGRRGQEAAFKDTGCWIESGMTIFIESVGHDTSFH